MNALHRAARARLARLRGEPTNEDAGFALIFVLLVTTVIMMGVATMLMVTANNIAPAKHSQDGETATAAAQAGLQRYLAYLNASCATFDSRACGAIADGPGTDGPETIDGADGDGGATFTITLRNAASYLTDGYLRVTATGTADTGARSLTADLTGLPSLLRFAYYSKYETLGSQFLDSYYGARNIAMTSAAAQARAGGAPSVSWDAPNSTAGSPGDVGVCDQLWYGTTGRAATKSPSLPIGTDWSESGSNGTLYQPCEVTFNSSMSFNGPVYTQDAPYLSYGSNGSKSGPTFTVPSKESLPPVSTAYPSTGSNHYRQFPIIGGGPSSTSTGYPDNTVQYRSYPMQLPATVVAASELGKPCIFVGPTRVLVNGATATVTSPQTTAPPAGADPTCYATRNATGQYLVDYTSSGGGIVYVENQTGSDPSKYTGQTPTTIAGAANTTFYLTNGHAATAPDSPTAVPSVWTQAGQNPQTWQVYNPSQSCWAVSRNPNTPNGPKPWEEQTFQCDWFGQMGNKDYIPASPPDDGYTAYRTALATDLTKTSAITITGNSGNSVSYTVNGGSSQTKSIDCSSAANTSFVPVSATANQLVCLVQHDLRRANTGGNDANWPNPSPTNYTHQYVVTGYSQTTSTAHNVAVGSAPSVDVGGDKFFDTTTQAGAPSTEDVTTTTTTFNVASQVFACYVYSLPGPLGSPTGKIDLDGSACKGILGLLPSGKWTWGDGYYPGNSSPQFQVTVSQKTYSNFKQGSTAAAYFPSMSDATQYHSAASGMGDAYVEGTGISGALSVVAQNDVVVTGKLTTNTGAPVADQATGEPSWTSGGAVDLIAGGNVRVYHPVSCAVTPNADTTPGYCPNDVTGLYDTTNPPSSIMNADGSLGPAHPSLQYCNMTPNSGTQNSACASAPTTGSGPVSEIDAAIFALNSSFLTDNYDRGTGIGPVKVVGGVYQVHRGATGEKWLSPATVSSAPPYSGYVLSIDYRNLLPANLPYVPAVSGGSSARAWNIVSVSSAPNTVSTP